jgi:nucleoside-diphosphate-sugar epimerase
MALHLITGGAGFIGSSLAEALLASVEAARAMLGYEPTVDVREGLKKTFEAFARFTR